MGPGLGLQEIGQKDQVSIPGPKGHSNTGASKMGMEQGIRTQRPW